MPEHVHLLLSEPERGSLAVALQMLKQMVSRKLHGQGTSPFWQPRSLDFARDFGSGLGRPLNASTSTFGVSRN